MTTPLYVIGDIHGQRDKLITVLGRAGLIRENLAWAGGDSRLWFMGDFFDRGNDGVGVVDLVMRLQKEAAAVGGSVGAVLGNHELLFLGAQRFGDAGGFLPSWRRNGGQERDLERIKGQQLAWLRGLPAMARVDQYLIIHADAAFYREYGSTIDHVNEAVGAIIRSDDMSAWMRLLEQFSERLSFASSRPDGILRASEFLRRFGGKQIIHGHTPIQYLTDQLSPTEPFIYSINLCINVDGGMYLGGSGFAYRTPNSQSNLEK